MDNVYLLPLNKFFHLAPDTHIKRFLSWNDMGGDPGRPQPFDHWTIRKRKDYRLETIPVQVLHKAEQIAFSAANLSLADTLQNSYFLFYRHFFLLVIRASRPSDHTTVGTSVPATVFDN